MKQYEKEIIQLQLNHEKDVLKELKEMYEEAEKQIDDKIQQLMADEQTQSKVYQLEYQKAIKGQISTILDNMNSHNYDYISDYLKKCYEDGYLSTMYTLHKQGIPLILPIDQEMVVKAIQLDSKLSKPLYESLGINTNDLKKAIRQEVSRGISNGYSYRDIARNIRNQMNIGLNKSIRIARTEGHRVNQESTMDGMYAAKDKGADIVKQWDATMDKKTRPSHQRVDGEIREIDERFSNGLMFPGDPEGSAGEVINCRCVLLQRARWAIGDETGNTKWDNENRKLVTIDSKNYQDFKQKYLENNNYFSNNVDVGDEELFASNIKKHSGMNTDYEKALKTKYANGSEDAKRVYNKYVASDSIDDSNYNGTPHYNRSSKKISMNYAEDLNDPRGSGTTYFHECGHLIDNASLENGYTSLNNKKFESLLRSDFDYYVNQMMKQNNVDQDEAYKKISSSIQSEKDHSVSDIIGGLTEKKCKGRYGHRESYWKKEGALEKEAFAHMYEAMFDKEKYDKMKEYFPNALKEFEKMLKGI